jgi:eukaryotic-like serine/threonine-protein kinase
MNKPRDPARGAPESASAAESFDVGSPAAAGVNTAGGQDIAPGSSARDDRKKCGEAGMVESTVTEGTTDDVTRLLPPETILMPDGWFLEVDEPPDGKSELDRFTDTVPDEIDEPLIDRPTMIAGYVILGVLGRGAMGVVYKARQRGLNRAVALKMIRAAEHSGPDELARFRGEAMAVAELNHPNIVQIYEVGEDHGQPFFSLEYVDGGSLAKKIDGVPQPPGEAALLVRSLAEAMESAHRRGIVHRDLKPANVLLTAAGEPKISDFGLVKRLADDAGQTQSGLILGSPGYMAPEQAEGRAREVGPLADVYGLGAILYHLLTGRPPFRAASVLDTLQQVRTQEPIPPSQFQPKLPRDLETICLKCLEKDPAKRYATAGDLAADLRRVGADEPIRARPVGRVERLWRWARRNPRVAALSGAVAFLVVAWSITSTWLYRLARANERTAMRAAAEARQNESLAERNAAEARRNAELAGSNEALAKRRAEVAKAIAQDAFNQMIRLGDQLLRRLQAKHDPERAHAEWLRLRDDLAAMLQKELVPIAQRIEGQGLTPFGLAAMHQGLGDLLRRSGQGEEARRQFQRAIELIDQVAQAQPDNDVARANLGVMHQRLGETALELDGDAQRALGEFQRAWDLQAEIARHPRSRNYTKADNHRLLSHAAIKLGIAELSLGHPAEAHGHFQTAWENRNAWIQAEPQNAMARSYLSEAELWLGVAGSRLGRWPESRQHLDQAIRICDELVRHFAAVSGFKRDLAAIYGALGDALSRRGDDAEAEKALRRSLQHAESALAQDPEVTTVRHVMAEANDRLAAIALRANRPAEAQRLFQASLEIQSELVRLEPCSLPRRVELALALAHCGRRDEAARKADELIRTAADRPALSIPLARCFAACAAGESDSGRRQRDVARMLEVLVAAIRNGFRDTVVLKTDPDFATFQAAPAFRDLVDGLEPKTKSSGQHENAAR